MQLHREHSDDLVGITLCLDYEGDGDVADLSDDVVAVLNEKEVACHNILCSDPIDEVLTALNADAVPVIRVYGRDGELAKTFPPGDYENEVIPFVKTMLRKEQETSAE